MKTEYNSVSEDEIVKTKKEKKSVNYFDYSLLCVLIFLICLGFVLLYSASSYSAQLAKGDASYYVKREIIFTIAGGVVGWFVIKNSKFFITLMNRMAMPMYIVSIVCVVMVVATPLGIERNGAKRWLGYGIFSFQPAEFVKFTVIVLTASLLSKCSQKALKDYRNIWRVYSYTIVATLSIMVLTSNLSSAIIIATIPAIMILVVGVPKKFVKQAIFLVALAAIPMGAYLTLHGDGFRLNRISVWLNPEDNAADGGFQVLQGLYAIGSGGLFGKGLGQSAQKLGFVPESANDMIFSIVCEELGLFGAVAIIVLFAFIIRRMRIIAGNAPDLFSSLLVVGVMAQISVQVVLNIAVVTNSIPNTGVSLPFISYGGTSILFLLYEMSLVLAVSKQIKRIQKEKELMQFYEQKNG